MNELLDAAAESAPAIIHDCMASGANRSAFEPAKGSFLAGHIFCCC